MNKYSYKIFYDITQDAWNWWNSLATYNQFKKLKTEEERQLGDSIKNKTFSEAKPKILNFLKEQAKKPDFFVPEFQQIMEKQFSEYFQPAITKLESVTNHPLAIDDYMMWRKKAISEHDPKATIPTETLLFPITTFPCMVAFYAEETFFTYAKIDDKLWGMPLDGTLHELLHLQCEAYWRDNPNSPVSQLSNNDYYILKESLTVILDEEWQPIITLPDCSYPEFLPLRQKLQAHWHQHHNFETLMQYGCKEVKKFTALSS